MRSSLFSIYWKVLASTESEGLKQYYQLNERKTQEKNERIMMNKLLQGRKGTKEWYERLSYKKNFM